MLTDFFQILIIIIITISFIHKYKPKIKFLFLGYSFFFFTLILQIPIKFFEVFLANYFTQTISISILFSIIITSIISEVAKYISLKKYLTTKIYKNAILFVIGWISLESLNIVTINFFKLIFYTLNITIDYSLFLNNYSFLNFIFFLIFNLALSVLVIFAVINMKIFYLILSIILSILVSFTLYSLLFLDKILFMILISLFSIYIIFKYNKL